MRIFGLLVVALAIGCGFAFKAKAATPSTGLEAFATEVSDEDLAEMRGKFIQPNNVSYFGIEMLTSWQGQDGITTNARLIVSLDFLNVGQVTPSLFVSWNRDGDSSLDVAAAGSGQLAAVTGTTILPVGGLDSVHGFVQHQQIAGNDNAVRNDMNVAIGPAGSVGFNTDGMTELTSAGSVEFADGDTLQFRLGDNQIGLVLTDGSDAVQQSISGGLNQLAQHVLIASNFNDVSNRMSTMIGIDPSAAATRLNVQNAVNGANGMGF